MTDRDLTLVFALILSAVLLFWPSNDCPVPVPNNASQNTDRIATPKIPNGQARTPNNEYT